MILGLELFAKKCIDESLGLNSIYINYLHRQDKAREEFISKLRGISSTDNSEILSLFELGFKAGYTISEIVAYGRLKWYEQSRWEAEQGDAVKQALWETVDDLEASLISEMSVILHIMGLLKITPEVIKWHKERLVSITGSREERRKLFRDAIDASLFTTEELLNYVSSKMTVIPDRLLVGVPKDTSITTDEPTIESWEEDSEYDDDTDSED